MPRIVPRQAALIALALLASVALAAPTEARQSRKKSMWGPVQVDGRSQFPIYRDLGVGVFQMRLAWSEVARSRPRPSSRDPRNPAYRWPAEVDYAIREARKYRIRVALQIFGAPRWANGNRSRRWAPRSRRSFANFATAAARRYPNVRLWMIWGEPSRRENFMPLGRQRRGRLTRSSRRGVRIYSQLLDAAYGAIKRVNRRNLVIGGNTFTTGNVTPRNFIRAMRLPGGRRPRMDMYGHNPFSSRRPNLRKRRLRYGWADFSTLDTLARWIDRYLGRRGGRRRGPRIKLFLSEFLLPTDHPNHEFNFWVTRRTQASWLRSALRITRRWRRIYTLGWFSLYDDPPRPHGDEVNRGLIDRFGVKKPAYFTFKRG